MKRLLEGIRVVDCSMFMLGPAAAAVLGDMGAEVIHVEHPYTGDTMRGLAVLFGVSLELGQGRRALFEVNNRNKKSLTADLRQAEGREIVYRLAKTADVFITNFMPEAIDEFSIDYQTISRHNPRIVYAQANAFGLEGPDKDRPGMDLIASARSGIMMESGEQGMPPVPVVTGLADHSGAMFVVVGILGALLGRERLGIAQKVDVSLLGSLIALQSSSVVTRLLTGEPLPRFDRANNRNPLYNYYECRDQKWLALSLMPAVKYWPTLCKAVGRAELEHDPRFNSDEQRVEHASTLCGLLDKLFATRDYSEWESIFRETDLQFGPVNSASDLLSDPQVLANGYIRSWDHPFLGNVRYLGSPIRYSETPTQISQPAPELGQHTEELLLELGYDWDTIGRLRDRQVI